MSQTVHRPATREFALSPEELARFHERGYLGPFKVYEVEEMKARWRASGCGCSTAATPSTTRTSAASGNTNISNYDRHLDIDFLADHICRPGDRRPGRQRPRPGRALLAHRVLPEVPGRRGHRLAPGRHVRQRLRQAADPVAGATRRTSAARITVWTAFTEATERHRLPAVHPRHAPHDVLRRDQEDALRPRQHQHRGQGAASGAASSATTTGELQIDPDWKPDESTGRLDGHAARRGDHVLVDADARVVAAQRQAPTRCGSASPPATCRPACTSTRTPTWSRSTAAGSAWSATARCWSRASNDYDHNAIATHTTTGHPFSTR